MIRENVLAAVQELYRQLEIPIRAEDVVKYLDVPKNKVWEMSQEAAVILGELVTNGSLVLCGRKKYAPPIPHIDAPIVAGCKVRIINHQFFIGHVVTVVEMAGDALYVDSNVIRYWIPKVCVVLESIPIAV